MEEQNHSAPIEQNVPRIDKHLNKFSQACTVALSALAFVLNLPWLAVVTAVVLAWSAVHPSSGPFRLLYRFVVVPSGLLKAHMVEDDPAPHRFAQGIGAIFLLTASLLLYTGGNVIVGWALVLIVFVLAGINFTSGFCAGCLVYYYLGRLGLLPRVRYQGNFHWRGV